LSGCGASSGEMRVSRREMGEQEGEKEGSEIGREMELDSG